MKQVNKEQTFDQARIVPSQAVRYPFVEGDQYRQ